MTSEGPTGEKRRALAKTVARVALRWSVIILVVMGLLRLLETSMLFHPDAAPTSLAIAGATPRLERWWIDSPEGRVEAFFVPGDGVSDARPGPVVIYAHGNAEVIDPLPSWLSEYREMGVSLLLPEYRGYGRSAGSPSEDAFRADFVAFYDRMVARPDVDRARIVYHGVSLGGGAVAQLARARAPAAFILQSTFTSVADRAHELLGVPRFLVSNRFDSLSVHRASPRPSLIFHGTRDQTIPISHGRALAAAIPESELVTCDADHNDLPPPELDYWGIIRRFLRARGILTGAAE